MADRVEHVLEQMVPEFDELLRAHLLSQAEVQALVRRRRNFEYDLNRRAPLRDDFLRAITFEMNAQTLVKGRKQKLGLDTQLISDYSFKRRILHIYDRALRKFSSDLSLWHQYLDYAAGVGGEHILGKAFVKYSPLWSSCPNDI
jgi:U3 small nucleolar RNA-associated protein 6